MMNKYRFDRPFGGGQRASRLVPTAAGRLFDQLADRDGRHVIPYTQRMAIGSVRRGEGGTGAAPYPKEWEVGPNRPDRLDDVLPDSKAKQAARDRGEPYMRYPVPGREPGTDKKN